jgi:hypothetical protein
MMLLTDAVVVAAALAVETAVAEATAAETAVVEIMAAVQLQFQRQLRLSLSQPHLLRKQCLLQPHRLTHRHSSLHDCTTISQRRVVWLACLEWPDNHVDLRWERTASCSVTSSL